MEGFSDRLEELYRSFSILESREDRERAVVDLSVALQVTTICYMTESQWWN